MAFHFSLLLPLKMYKSLWKWQAKSVWRVPVEVNYFGAVLTLQQKVPALPSQVNNRTLGRLFLFGWWPVREQDAKEFHRGKSHGVTPISYKMFNLPNYGKLWDVYWSPDFYGIKSLPLFIILSQLGRRQMFFSYFAYYSIFYEELCALNKCNTFFFTPVGNFKLWIDILLSTAFCLRTLLYDHIWWRSFQSSLYVTVVSVDLPLSP